MRRGGEPACADKEWPGSALFVRFARLVRVLPNHALHDARVEGCRF
jgi:hypothetical protein